MNAQEKWLPVARQTLSAEEGQAVVLLRDRCNVADGLDLKTVLPIHGSAETEAFDRANAFLIYVNDSLVGYCSLDGDQHSVEICGMVAPEQRRRGIGGSLLAAARAACKAHGVEEMLLICEDASSAGKAFLAAHGSHQEFAEHRMELQDFEAMSARLTREPRLVLRRAGREETGTLAYTQAAVFGTPSEVVIIQAGIEQEFASPVARCYLGELDGTPVSSLKLYLLEGRASIYAFGVLPEYRRRGLAGQTLALLTNQLQAEGITRIGLEVETTNLPAFTLYQACGFSPITTYGYYSM